MSAARVVELETPTGPARAHVHEAKGAKGALVLGHGAGGGIDAVDLVALAAELPADGWTVVLVEMPWRVAGKKVAPPPRRLDEGWVPVIAGLRADGCLGAGPLVVGGRSAGARVACRTAEEVGASGVLALSFPLVPPGKGPDKSRIGELVTPVAAGLPVLVAQGEKDPFGTPSDLEAALAASGVDGATDVEVVAAPGAHSFRRRVDVEPLVAAVRAFVTAL